LWLGPSNRASQSKDKDMYLQAAWILFALFLYIVCAIVLVVEVFIPSFGLLTLLSLGAFGWATTIFFQISTTAGWCGLAAATVIIPAFWIVTYKLFPKTALGRALELKGVDRSAGDAIADQERLLSFAGKSGTAVSSLRPVGVCLIDGYRVVCSAQAGFIEKNTAIEVVSVEGQLVRVRIKNET